MNFSAYNTFNINSCLLENETLKTERRLDHHDDQIAHHGDHLAHHDNQLAKLHQQLKPQTSDGSTANGSYQFILCSFIMGFYTPSSDGTYYGMVMFVRPSVRVPVRPSQFSALFSYML